MKILISGSTGLLGTALMQSMHEQGHETARLVRPGTEGRLREISNSSMQPGTQKSGTPRNVLWDPVAGLLDNSAEGANVVVHLAGASIADSRWTPARKHVLQESRVAATRHLVGALGRLRQPPQIFIAASAIGFYGDRGDEELTEDSAPGTDFLAQLTRNWEAESARAKDFGARVVILRISIRTRPTIWNFDAVFRFQCRHSRSRRKR